MVRSGTSVIPNHIPLRDRAVPVPLVWACLLLAYCVLIFSKAVSGTAATWLTDIAWTVAPFIAALATWRTSRRLTGKRRTAWMFFAAAAGAWFLGQLVWDWNELFRGRALPVPTIGDVGYTALGVFMIAGLLQLRATQTVPRLTPQRLANIALIICSLLVALMVMVVEPMLSTRVPVAVQAVLIVQTLSFVAALIAALYFIWSYRWNVDLLPLVLLTAGLTAHVLASLAYTHNLMTEHFGPNDAVNALWIAAFGFQHWAASEEVLADERRRSQSAVRWEGHGWIEALVPSFLLFFIALTSLAYVQYASTFTIVARASLLVAFSCVLAFREAWLYSRGLQIQARLARSNTELDIAREQLKRIAEERTELERDTQFTARAGGLGLWDWNLRTQHVDYSPEWKRQLGYEEFELGSEVQVWHSRIHPDDARAVVESQERYLQHPFGEHTAEMRLRHRDGSYRWILSRSTVHLDKHGTPVRMLGVHMDITVRKEMEMALRQSEARYRELAGELEKRVTERTADLREAYRESQSFAYAVAHDLKAPLRAIDSFSHLLCESARERLTQEEKAYVSRVRRGAMQMASLIDGLLAYSRIEHREVSLKEIELRSYVAELIGERQQAIEARGAQVEIDIPPDLRLHADREGLGMVLRNLLDNALKFTGNAQQPRIEIGAAREQQTVKIWVRDNGIGFDPAYHDKIFEIFQRLHRLDEYEGTGIGLALARKAMQRMRGRIWAQSQPGKGSTFYLELPAVDAPAHAQRAIG